MKDDQGHRFSKYAPGWPLILSVGVKLGVPWIVDPLLGVLLFFLMLRYTERRLGEKSVRVVYGWCCSVFSSPTTRLPSSSFCCGDLHSVPSSFTTFQHESRIIQAPTSNGWRAPWVLGDDSLHRNLPLAALVEVTPSRVCALCLERVLVAGELVVLTGDPLSVLANTLANLPLNVRTRDRLLVPKYRSRDSQCIATRPYPRWKLA